ncbi:MAG: hypothetical protein U0798_13325 [Gemmataceae bacterium]
MRTVLLVLVALAFTSASFTSVSQAQSKSKKEVEWIPHESDSQNWKTLFPGKAKSTSRTAPSKAGELTISTVSLESRDVVYAVVATKFPESLNDADPKKLIAAARDALTASGGKVILDEKILVSGPRDTKYDGQDVTVEFGKNRIRTRLVYANSCLYQVSVTGQDKGLSTENAKKFMTAFEITK